MTHRSIPRHLLAFAAVVFLSSSATADPNGYEVAAREGAMLWSDESITIRGTWVAAGAYEWPLVDRSNATSIECHREAMRCLESRAGLGRAKGVPATSLPNLFPLALFYDVQSWNEGIVVAIRPTGRLEIDSTKGTVKLLWTQNPQNEVYFSPAQQEFTIPIKNKYQTRMQGSTKWWMPYSKP